MHTLPLVQFPAHYIHTQHNSYRLALDDWEPTYSDMLKCSVLKIFFPLYPMNSSENTPDDYNLEQYWRDEAPFF